jgi:hypothetical protein
MTLWGRGGGQRTIAELENGEGGGDDGQREEEDQEQEAAGTHGASR